MTRLHRVALGTAFGLVLAATALAPRAHAGPGAHGPDGEHLDTPGSTAALVDSSPRLEAATELYELVARLDGDRLSIFVDAYATNAPVLGADLTVESGTLQAPAKFDAARGDYVVDDPKLIAALSREGEHALVFTLVAGDDSDLLEGHLVQTAAAHDHDQVLGLGALEWLGVFAVVVALGGGAWFARQRGAAGRLLRVTEGA